jgi:amino acid adenylation domain-containing protein
VACLHHLFERQADRTPEAVALVFADRELKYGELERRANRVAHRLLQVGVPPDAPVAVCAEPSFDMMSALLGVLKAGGAYVPLDPTAPAERLRLLLSDLPSPVLLAQGHLTARWRDLPVRLLVLGEQDEEGGREDRPAVGVTADHLAYVLFTSGSTGTPKGVMVPHRSICATLHWRQSAFPLGPEDRVLQTFSYTFDASIWELFAPLFAGARLVLTGPEVWRDSTRVVEGLARHRITVMQSTPSRLRLLLEERGLDACRDLRRVFSGGEALTRELQVWFFARLGADLLNLYGPTETALDATCWACRPNERRPAVPIGRAITGKRLYLLDEQQRPVAAGAPGELYIGGTGLARGYLGSPGRTAERFLPDPFTDAPGARMYRTGDLCRRLPEGELVFLGRLDRQVKIRGFRIEPGEVEAVLVQHPAVWEAAVVPREDAPVSQRLAAYVVPRAGGAPDAEALRGFLRQRLPEYMIPSEYVPLDGLPRTASGKIDRLALPAPSRARPAGEPPRDPLERFLAGLWEEVLGASGVGPRDNFFDLGGTSLQVAVLTHRLQERLGEYVYTVALYDAPTVAGLAQYLRDNYPDGVTRLFGPSPCPRAHGTDRPVGVARVDEMRHLLRTLPPRPARPAAPKNPRAVFVLSPPRSGSTLFRVLLGGHPALFAPPELQLLNFDTLAQRRAAFDRDRDRFWLDGTVRAIVEARPCDAAEAARMMEDCERRGLTVREFYGLLQGWLGGALLVDKTPTYALDGEALRRAEEDFEEPLFIHLIRHPAPVIRSFEEAKLHVFFPPFFREPHPFSVCELAELVWTVSHQNILEFLRNVPAPRQLAVRFEDLVRRPEEVMTGVARFLGVPFHAAMTDPFRQDHKSRMTDGLHPMARMLGDVKFHEHRGIDAQAARRDKGRHPEERLGEITRSLACALGYPLPGRGSGVRDQGSAVGEKPTRFARNGRASSSLTPDPWHLTPGTLVCLQQGGTGTPFFWVHAAGGDVSCYRELSRALGTDRPCYAFQAPGLDRRQARPRRIEDLASAYVEALCRAHPQGPYQLGGWSMGGVVAFEMARQLVDRGEALFPLVLLDSDVPRSDQKQPALGLARFLAEFARQYGLDFDPGLSVRDAVLSHLLEQVKRARLVPPDLVPAQLRGALRRHARFFLSNLRALRRYQPGPWPGRLLLFRPAQGPASGTGPKLDWRTLARHVTICVVPGNHYTMIREPHVRILAEEISALLRGQSENR